MVIWVWWLCGYVVVLCGFTCGKILFDVFPRTQIHVDEEQCSCFAPIAYKGCVSPQNLNVKQCDFSRLTPNMRAFLQKYDSWKKNEAST